MRTDVASEVEAQIDQWRTYMRSRTGMTAGSVEELEEHLRDGMDDLQSGGLARDEAFLIAIKRMGNQSSVAAEYAREHSGRLWKQLAITPDESPADDADGRRSVPVMLFVATVIAFVTRQAFEPFNTSGDIDTTAHWILGRSIPFVPLLGLALYFGWMRRARFWGAHITVPAIVATAVVVNLTARSDSQTMFLAVGFGVALAWLIVGVGYSCLAWRSVDSRMNYLRFTGELVVYYVLVAMGGGALLGLAAGVFYAIDVHFDDQFIGWLIPMLAIGAVVVCAWLVEAKKSVIENIVPVLARIFTPLALILQVGFLFAAALSGTVVTVDREVLLTFTAVMLLALGLLLYSVSARDADSKPELFDWVQVGLIASALLIDLYVLLAMVLRIEEFGATPNKVMALCLNLIIAVNLAWSGWLYVKFLRGRGGFVALERWQTQYLDVFAVFAVVVVAVFPPLFNYT